MGRTRIAIKLIIEVDPAEWANATGIGDADGKFTIAAVRDDVRSHVLTTVQGSTLIIDEASGEVTSA